MDVKGPGGGGGMGPALGDGNPFAVAQKAAPKVTEEQNMSIGEKLNQMSGVADEKKNLYKGKQEMGKEAFLKLFMEQLKYQDPMDPVKNDQFNQQMAMFSQLEQQVNMNKNLEKMLNQQNNTQIAALQLVGKDVLADRGALYHEKDKYTPMAFKLPQDMREIKVEIQDQIGETVRTFKLDARPAGDTTWKWDGQNDQGMPVATGKYSYKISGLGNDGKEIKINNKVEGRVNGVTSAQGVTFLMVGDQKIALNDVETIREHGATEAQAALKGLPALPGMPGAGTNPTAVGGAVAGSAANVPGANSVATAAQASNSATPANAQSAASTNSNPASATQPATSAPPQSRGADKNWDLSHDSFEEIPDTNDGSTAGTQSVSNSSQPSIRDADDNDFDGNMPPMMPLFTR